MNTRRKTVRVKNPTQALRATQKSAESIAREAVEEQNPGNIGTLTHIIEVDEYTQLLHFEATVPGYQNWEWVVAVVDPGVEGYAPTVSEYALQAGEKAHTTPQWIPFEERVLPGDLKPGDLLPPKRADSRLEFDGDEFTLEQYEQDGFLRNAQAEKQLTQHGMREALLRWKTQQFGPHSAYAQHAQEECRTCAFFLPLESPSVTSRVSGIGLCANEFSPADGHVVDQTFGCGAHSDTQHTEHWNQPDG